MLNNIKKNLTIGFITDGRTDKCDGCISKHGAYMVDVKQALYLTISYQERDLTQIHL